MKIFIAHNYYQQAGGEDVVFAAEADLLESQGHTVHRFTMHNDDVNDMGRLQAAGATLWNRQVYKQLRQLFGRENFDIAHFHNTFPLISPAAYSAARAEGIPVVQTLHNYRLMCSAATFFRDGHVCEQCMGKILPWPGVAHACYRDSKAASGVVALMLTTHRLLGTWKRTVDRYIVLSEFARQKFIEAGLPPKKLSLKPNFLQNDPGISDQRGDYMVFAGRFTHEKGIMTLLNAWRQLPDVSLKVIGDGPLMEEARAFVQTHQLQQVELLGYLKREESIRLVRSASALVFPSEWYEGLPLTIIESFACGTPVIASRIGAVMTLVDDRRTGLHFTPGDPNDLAAKVQELRADPSLAEQLSQSVRQEYETLYAPQQNYARLMEIYTETIAEALTGMGKTQHV